MTSSSSSILFEDLKVHKIARPKGRFLVDEEDLDSKPKINLNYDFSKAEFISDEDEDY